MSNNQDILDKTFNIDEEINSNRFKIVGRIYQDDYSKCIFLVFDSQTGKIKKRTFTIKKTEKLK